MGELLLHDTELSPREAKRRLVNALRRHDGGTVITRMCVSSHMACLHDSC